jgi:hypothetical protein
MKIIIATLVSIFIICFYLEYNHSNAIEMNNNNLCRINKKNLHKNPYQELSRYIKDCDYYTNIWRNSAITASIVSLMFLFYFKDYNVKISTVQILLLFIFTMFISYNSMNYKYRHQYSFINKSLTDVLDEINKNKDITKLTGQHLKDYIPITANNTYLNLSQKRRSSSLRSHK